MHPKRALRSARCTRAGWRLAHGVDIVPLKPQSKELQPGYGTRQAHITCLDFAHQWFLNTDANLGVVLGGAAGLVVADWDDVPQYESWCAGSGAGVETLTEQTARGYHLFFTYPGLRSSVADGCELKATGVCMVAPSVHPSGVVYRIVKDVPIARIDCVSASLLFPFLSVETPAQDRRRYSNVSSISLASQMKNNTSAPKGLIARIKVARAILDEMGAAGIKLRGSGSSTLVGLCPFHQDQTPSLWVNPRSGVWGCNKPDCPAAGTHDVINFRAIHRGISNATAIGQLAREFLKPNR
ncbi:MAG: bifunctional DNA primase/polymerase [Chloroflexi bacterium]|nr:bifunctional DNA primase/polymerase [Chloroflexota bacterium]